MSDDEILILDDDDRYARLRLISWWRQEKLLASKVLVVGAGALGNEVLKNLALLGVGQIFVIDMDTIDKSNLTRSVLFRAEDRGLRKVDVAAVRTRELNPDVRVTPIHGDVMLDLGLGLFRDIDVTIGCLDNREARLFVNRASWRVSKPWVDGAIQEISGVAKVFVPPTSACYECAMTEADYKLINLRYSCPLLKREDMLAGKVPTAPTISSFIAGLQTQEALKLIHGMEVQAGSAFIFNGVANTFYTTKFPFRDDCLSHETYDPIESFPLSTNDTVATLLEKVAGTALELDRDFLVGLTCPKCGDRRAIDRPLAAVAQADAFCPKCREMCATETIHRVDKGSALAARPLRDLAVPPYDIVRVQTSAGRRFILLANDRTHYFPT